MRVFLLEQGGDHEKKCPGCNWESYSFYGYGETEKSARSNYEFDDEYGQGLCAECLAELLVSEEVI